MKLNIHERPIIKNKWDNKMNFAIEKDWIFKG